MPEGDTVFLAATRMHAALAGQRLVGHFRVPRNAMHIGEKGSGWDSVQAKSVRRGCEGVKVVADAVEGYVRDAVIAAFDDPELGLKLRKRFAAKLASPALEQAAMEKKKTATEALARLGDDYADGLLTGPQVDRATRRLQQRIDAAEAELADIRQSSGIMVELPGSSAAMRAAWDEWNLEERRQVVRLAIERVWVRRAGQGRRFTAERVEFDWLR